MNSRSLQIFSIGMLIISFLGITSFINNSEPVFNKGFQNPGKLNATPADKKWKGYMITKDRLQDYFTDNGTLKAYKKLIISISIPDFDEPSKSMRVFLCAAKNHTDYCQGGYVKELLPDPNYAEFPAQENLILGNTEIPLANIKKFLFDPSTGTWRAGFHHLRLIPLKSHDFENYMAFGYEACKIDGTIITFISKKTTDESNPTPPGRPE